MKQQQPKKDQYYQKHIDKDPKREYFPTNNILIDEKAKVIYLPGFMRLKFKNFNDMDIGSLSALLNGEIIFVIYYGEAFEIFGDSKDKEIEETLMKKVVLLFARDNAIKLTNDDDANKDKDLDIRVNHDKEKHEIKFVVKKIFKLYLDSQVFLTPFEVINGILEITVQSVSIKYPFKDGKPQGGKIEFNLQNNSRMDQKVQFANWGTFGNYDLAQQRIGALYTNYRISQAKEFLMSTSERIDSQKKKKIQADKQSKSEQIIGKIKQTIDDKKQGINPRDFDKTNQINISDNQRSPLVIDFKQKQAKIQAFHYAYFNIPLYKFPLSALITIFMPLFFLDVLNFGILFQDSSLSDRIAAIATLVLAFAALIPTIRSQIPPNPRITLIQILVYLQTLPTLLAIIQSLDVYDNFALDSSTAFVQDWVRDGFFWVAFCISLITFLIILVLVMFHYFKWYPEYNAVAARQNKPLFDRKRWRNTQCNLYFDENYRQDLLQKENVVAIMLSKKEYQQKYSIPQSTVRKIKTLLKKQQKGKQAVSQLKLF